MSGDPLLLNSDKILCSKCAMQIKTKIDELYNTKEEANFKKLREEILSISKDLYNTSVVDELRGLIDRIAQRREFILEPQLKDNKKCGNNEGNVIEDTSNQKTDEMVECSDLTDKSVLKIQNEQLKTLKSIESMIKFFVVLTIIGISISVISFLIVLANF